MRVIDIQANKLKKFDLVELLFETKMIDFIQFNGVKEKNNSFMVIHFMDKSKTHCTTDELVKVNRPKKTYVHRRFEQIEY